MVFNRDEPHRHNYFPFQKLADFEPTDLTNDEGQVLYRRMEYMLLNCSCGHSIKQLIVPGKAE